MAVGAALTPEASCSMMGLEDFLEDIVYMPCGCFIDTDTVRVAEIDGHIVVECSWCESVFDRDAVGLWAVYLIAGEIQVPPVRSFQMPLYKLHSQIFNFVGKCQCGTPILRNVQRPNEIYHLQKGDSPKRIGN
jgi:hypothetical protein